jgi:hypothetical protein
MYILVRMLSICARVFPLMAVGKLGVDQIDFPLVWPVTTDEQVHAVATVGTDSLKLFKRTEAF